EPGEYDARFFINDGYTRLAISEPFTVVIQEPPVLSPSPLIGTLSPETGLVLYLPLDNDSQDMSGSGNHGVPTSTLIVPGKIGQAYDFNGIDSTVITPLDINPEKIPEMSVTCWAYPRSSNGRRQVWSQDDGGFDRSLLVENDGWSVFIGGSDWITGKSVDLKQWQFLAVIFTSTDVIFYKNGEKFSYGTAGGTGMISSNTFTLGDNPAGYSEFFDGLIDEVRVYNRALGDEEIQSLFTASSPPVHNDNLNSMATNDWISAQRGNLVFEVPLNWKPLETDSLNLGGWYNGEDPNFPDGVISIMKATSLDAAKEDLIIDQENSLIIDNKMAKFTEGHYVQNKVRARFYFFEKVTVEQENLLIFVAAKDSLWNSFLPIEKHFIESVRFTDKLM
ncbi:MAG: LamG domain-containing protein, partial [Atribacterota bacterium]|nr:LamG domain-containing protein [Atribacterota bacterium]